MTDIPRCTCAFCGNEPAIEEERDRSWTSECVPCGIMIAGFDTKQMCIDWWNRRPKPILKTNL